ncbi:hypothetical protein LMG29542_07164 [Paraburkholderia humisilvae]|uniref:Uncharacterized protein n=1 Tax=Paraburkholderia humisilvae TaxID=627669 RepID=A0A6J5F7Z8_9BURK|nr:hypothetical protein LMG29542_07164 [Paraburkholderia humisilvae]
MHCARVKPDVEPMRRAHLARTHIIGYGRRVAMCAALGALLALAGCSIFGCGASATNGAAGGSCTAGMRF